MAEFKLKNSKGVEQIFNHNKIFVEGTDGELVQFTEGTGEVKLQDKTILENGEYTADEGFDGLGSVTVAVEGSGGGSLPAGVYWEQVTPTAPRSYTNIYCESSGKLYTFVKTSSSEKTFDLYDITNGEYSLVASATLTFTPDVMISHNGKIHFFLYKHVVFDGTTFSTLNDAPYDVYRKNTFVYNGKLNSFFSSPNTVYAWDEETDTWGVVNEFSALTSSIDAVFVHEGTLHFTRTNNELWKQVDGVNTKIRTLTVRAYPSLYCNGYLYYCNQVWGVTNLYRQNIDTGEEDIFPAPYFGSGYSILNYNGIRITGGSSTWNNHLVLHEVAE